MKLYSDNETVQKAFTDPLTRIGIPIFFGLFLIFIILGFVVSLHPVLTLLISFSVSILVWYIIISKWFEKHIKMVSDPVEFYERSLKQGMILKWSADNIAKRNNIQLNHRKTPYKELETVKINEGLILKNDTINIDNKDYSWNRIKNYDLKAKRSIQFSHFLTFTFTDNTQLHMYIKVDDGAKLDYLFDKYINNKKIQLTQKAE